MPTELSVRAVRETGMCFTASTGQHSVCLDYPLGPGATAGPTPLEMLLTSLAVCAGSTVALVLERMKQPLAAMTVEAKGTRREEHPTVLTTITLEFGVAGAGLDADRVAQALAIAEGQLCPVWAMLKAGTPITATFHVVES